METNLKSSPLHQETYFLDYEGEKLHLKRFYINEGGTPVFMLHGSIENGKIYYSSSLKGLAPFLARQGFDVFVPDLRGKGESKPPVSKASTYGQSEMILEDLTIFLNKIRAIKGDVPQHWVGHSWGGTLLYAHYLRFHQRVKVASMVHFGVKRRITVQNFERFFILDLVWGGIGSIATKMKGYMPSKDLGIGSENEPKKYYKEVNSWFKMNPWLGSDGFNYTEKIKEVTLPPALFFCGIKDTVLGAAKDSRLFIEELQLTDYELVNLSKHNGNLVDYGHVNMLTHAKANQDHFLKVADWMRRYDQQTVPIPEAQ